jgi:hypothetical protein
VSSLCYTATMQKDTKFVLTAVGVTMAAGCCVPDLVLGSAQRKARRYARCGYAERHRHLAIREGDG